MKIRYSKIKVGILKLTKYQFFYIGRDIITSNFFFNFKKGDSIRVYDKVDIKIVKDIEQRIEANKFEGSKGIFFIMIFATVFPNK